MLADFRTMCEAEELKAATIGQHWPIPATETVQPAKLANDLLAGPQSQVVRIAQHHLSAGGADLFDFQPLNAGPGSDRHKGRHLDRPMRRLKRTPPRGTTGIRVVKLKREM